MSQTDIPRFNENVPVPQKSFVDSFRDAFRNRKLVGLLAAMAIIANCEGKCSIFSKEAVSCSCTDKTESGNNNQNKYEELKVDKSNL